MNIKNINEKFSINEWLSYSNPLLKPFIDANFNHNIKGNHYKLFHDYIFQFGRMCELFDEHIREIYDQKFIKDNFYTKKDLLNFKNRRVREWFDNWRVTYIGLTKIKSKGYLPLFLYLSEFDDTYSITGFCIKEEKENDVKTFEQIKNKYIYVEQDNYSTIRSGNGKKVNSLFDNIKAMSDLTKQNN